VAAAAGIAILVGGAFFTPQLATTENGAIVATEPSTRHAPAAGGSLKTAGAVTTGDDLDAADSSDAFTDLYGNEVSDAIATYTFDQSGSLYELHSPQTELPRLGIPKS
jgi:hypothetical protein